MASTDLHVGVSMADMPSGPVEARSTSSAAPAPTEAQVLVASAPAAVKRATAPDAEVNGKLRKVDGGDAQCSGSGASADEINASSSPDVGAQDDKTVNGFPSSIELVEKMRLLEPPAEGATVRWIRVVHSGYGNEIFADEVAATGYSLVGAKSRQEGYYIKAPEDQDIPSFVERLKAINKTCRDRSAFKEMKRSNKSRVHFKSEVAISASSFIASELQGSIRDHLPYTAQDGPKEGATRAPPW